MTVVCKSCGTIATDDEAAFCGSCGEELDRTGAAGAEVPAEDAAGVGVAPDGGPRVARDSGPGATADEVPARPGRTIPEEPIPAALVPPLAPFAGAPREAGFAKAKHLAVGTLIDKKYAVLRVLGEGGMGVVYLARDIHTGLDVVVKAVRAELAHRDDVRARTLAEGRALAQIDHPNVVHLRAVAVDGPSLFLVMQYIDGESLDRIIARHAERGEPMPVGEALGIFRQVAAGVAAAHEEGVIHRDLKPANVLVRKKDGVAKVTDFGIALVPSDSSRPMTRGVIGSLWYMSPEQVTGRRDLDHRVDVYALGVLLYQMLVGRVPFDAKSDIEIMKLQAEAPMPRVLAVRPDVPPAVDDVLQKACAKDRAERYQRCDELVAAIDRVLATVAAQAPAGATPPIPLVHASSPSLSAGSGTPAGVVDPTRPGEIAAKARRRTRTWIAVGVVAVAAAGGGAAVAFGLVPGVAGVPALAKLLKPARKKRHDVGGAAGASATAAAPSPDAGAPASALASLVGPWVGNGRELDAVLSGNDLEFRVKKPEQFAPQGYEAGEPRFVLRATSDPNVFAVEDRIRPVPPTGKTYDAKARGTCQEVWTTAGGEPLHARWDPPKLSVEFAKIEPSPANFTSDGAKVTSCVGLRALKASKVRSTLTRP